MTQFNAGMRWNSEPIMLPVHDRETGKQQDVWVIYNLAACFDLEVGDNLTTLWGDLGMADKRFVRQINQLAKSFRAQYPRADGDCETDSEYAAYDKARETYETTLANLRKEHAPVRRSLNLRTISEVVTTIGGKHVEDPPNPKDAESWADWPDMLLDWITEAGLETAKASARSKKSGG